MSAVQHLAERYQQPDITEDEILLIEDSLFLQYEADYGTEANQQLLDQGNAIEFLVNLYQRG